MEYSMEILYVLEKIRNPFLDGLMQAITWFGEETLALPLLLIFYWCVNKKLGLQLFFTTFLGAGVNAFLKLTMQVPRPWLRDPNFTIVESARKAATGFSFPSGHTQTAVSIFGVLALWMKKNLWRVAFVLLILLIGLSRLYLGVHSSDDVLFSLIVGLAIVVLSHVLFARSEKTIAYSFLILFLINVAFIIIMPFIPLLNPTDAPIAHHLYKHCALAISGSAALCLAAFLPGKHKGFDPKAPWLVQLVKFLLGLALVMALRAGLKPLLALFLSNDVLADTLRYFFVSLFGIMFWPMCFDNLERLLSFKK